MMFALFTCHRPPTALNALCDCNLAADTAYDCPCRRDNKPRTRIILFNHGFLRITLILRDATPSWPPGETLNTKLNYQLGNGLFEKSKYPILLNQLSVSLFLLVDFICRCASTRLPMRFGSAVDAHQQRERCASANNFAVQK